MIILRKPNIFYQQRLWQLFGYFHFFYSKESAKPTHVKNGDKILFSLNVRKDNWKASGLHHKSVLPNHIQRKHHCLSKTFRCQKINNFTTTSLKESLEGNEKKKKERSWLRYRFWNIVIRASNFKTTLPYLSRWAVDKYSIFYNCKQQRQVLNKTKNSLS